MKGIQPEALQHIIERPKFLDDLKNGSRGGRTLKIIKIAETLKLMDKTKCLAYDVSEFETEFGKAKSLKGYMMKIIKEHGVKNPRMIVDSGKVYIWQNN